MTRRNEAGQALIFAVVALGIVLMGFVGLGIDMGVMRYQKRLLQTAADAAAIAAASDLKSGSITTAAVNAVTANGFSGSTLNTGACPATVTSLTVTVNNPPSSGPHTTGSTSYPSTDYVEACVAELQPTYFMRILGINSQTVSARAVATDMGSAGPSNGCLYTLGQPSSSVEGVNVNGSININATTCGIVDNGNFNTKGNAFVVKAGSFGVAGCDAGSSGKCGSGPGGSVTCYDGQPSCPEAGVPTSGDPMSYLQSEEPCTSCAVGPNLSFSGSSCTSSTGSCAAYATYNNGVWTVNPGTYGSFNIGPAKVNFGQGNYVIDTNNGPTSTGLYIGANATVTGTGVFFYFTNQATVGGTGTPAINLTAPSSGIYANVLFFEDPNDCNNGGPSSCGTGPQLGGNSSSDYSGILYFPKDNLTFFGNNNSISIGIVIADALTFSGNPTINLAGATGLPTGEAPILRSVLVE